VSAFVDQPLLFVQGEFQKKLNREAGLGYYGRLWAIAGERRLFSTVVKHLYPPKYLTIF
jgi:hypothetical protein